MFSNGNMVKVLELFSGTGSVSKICKELGWEVVSLDLKGADINMSILDWDYENYDGEFDVIWASPPCHTFSKLRHSWIGRTLRDHGDTIITKDILTQDIIAKGLPLLDRALDIIQHFTPAYWFIENPASGRMEEWMQGIPKYTVDYCMYSDWGYKKRTNVWTNVETFQPKLCDKKCGNMDGKAHKRQAVGSTGLSLKDRYRIPPDLIRELFNSCN